MELSAIDFEHLVRGWQGLVGARVQKVYLKDRTHVFQLYRASQQSFLVTDGVAFLTSAKLAWPKTPSGYCMFLRRRLAGARISAIKLLGWERIVIIDFDTSDGPASVILELIGEVNSMFVKDKKIVSCLRTHNYGARVVRGGIEYVPPPSRLDPTEVPFEELIGKPAAKTIATLWGLGGKWAEELCARAEVERGDLLCAEQITKLLAQLQQVRSSETTPVHDKGEALPLLFKTKPSVIERTATFDAAIDAVMKPQFETEQLAKENTSVVTLRSKQERILDAQRKQLTKLEANAAKEQRVGELLYEHYSELTALIEEMKEDWKKLPLGEIREKYEQHRLVKQISDDGTFEVELGE